MSANQTVTGKVIGDLIQGHMSSYGGTEVSVSDPRLKNHHHLITAERYFIFESELRAYQAWENFKSPDVQIIFMRPDGSDGSPEELVLPATNRKGELVS